MSTTSATRITIPPHTPLTPNVRSAINSALLTSNAIPSIQAALLHECQASGFVAAVRARVLELLRSGECASYTELMGAVMEEVKGGGGISGVVGENGVNGAGANGKRNGAGLEGGTEGGRLRVPQRVVEEGVHVVKAALEPIVTVGEES